MQNIYNQIMCENKNRGLTPVEDLLGDSRYVVEQKLNQLGFITKGLSVKQIATLFFALVDILFIVKDDSFYLVTMSEDKLKDLMNQGRLLPRKDDTNYNKTSSIIYGNNCAIINKFLSEGKFHFIKLVPAEGCECKSFFCTLSTMNPYPTLDNEKVYTLTDVNTWYKDIVTNLVRGTCKINNTYIASSYMSRLNNTSTCGLVFFTNNEGDLSSLPIWKIKRIEPYTDNDNLNKLLSGVCQCKDEKVTMNRQILEEYYGSELYQRLESKNVRYKYCLEELLVCSKMHDVWYYKCKYGITERFNSINELESFLVENTKLGDSYDSVHCNARKLCPSGQIGDGKKSFYMKVKLDSKDLIELKDYSSIMPKLYTYYAISNMYGYRGVDIKSTSDDLAIKKGKEEFERQFGNNKNLNTGCLALLKEGKLIRGKQPYNFNIDTQRALCQNIMYGYKKNYQGYVKYIRDLYKCTNLSVFPSDELIQFLYINNLAIKYKNGADVILVDVIKYLLDFFDLLSDKDKATDKLHDAWRVLAYKQCKKEYKRIVDSYPNLKDYLIEDTPDGEYIVTEFGRYKVLKDGIAKTVSLRYRGVELGNKRIGENK